MFDKTVLKIFLGGKIDLPQLMISVTVKNFEQLKYCNDYS